MPNKIQFAYCWIMVKPGLMVPSQLRKFNPEDVFKDIMSSDNIDYIEVYTLYVKYHEK